MKKIIFIFLIFTKVTYAENFIKPIVQINDLIITNIDIENEIKFIRTVYQIDPKKKLLQSALSNLIDDTLKLSIINENNIIVDKQLVDNEYNSFLAKISKNNNIDDKIKKNIYQKVKQEIQWNMFISRKYSWRVSINMREIDSILNNELNKHDNFELLNKKKEDLIKFEKNKKLQVYSETYLKELKNKSLIKYFK